MEPQASGGVPDGTAGALSLVLCDVYGEPDTRPKLLSLLFSAAQRATSLDMTPGPQRVDLVYVDDVCAAYLHAADEMLAWRGGRPYRDSEVMQPWVGLPCPAFARASSCKTASRASSPRSESVSSS
jgi:hypothetical protein